MRHLVVAGSALGLLLNTGAVWACATCLCGDPTITTMGTEKPFAGRMRVSVDYLSRSEAVGIPGVSEHKIDEERISYSLSYAPNENWILAASLPTASKKLLHFDLERERASGIGDLDLSARWFLGKDESFPTRKLWGLQFGLRVPTSSEQKKNGQPVDFDAQPGAGATIPSLGGWYGRYQLPWFFYGSAVYQHAVNKGYQGFDSGDVLLVTGLSQYALNPKLALQLSLDGRLKQKDEFFGASDPDSGGLLVMTTPGIAWTPVTDVIFNLSYQIPTLKDLNGRQVDDPILHVGVTYDF